MKTLSYCVMLMIVTPLLVAVASAQSVQPAEDQCQVAQTGFTCSDSACGCGDGCCNNGCSGANGCCGRDCCVAKVEKVQVEKHCWCIKPEKKCVPRVVCPWAEGGSGLTIFNFLRKKHAACGDTCGCSDVCGCADACCDGCCGNDGCCLKPRCGKVICVRDLEKKTYECEKCVCKWEIRRLPPCCDGCGADCCDTVEGYEAAPADTLQYPAPAPAPAPAPPADASASEASARVDQNESRWGMTLLRLQ